MIHACPISSRRIDANTVRMSALFTALSALLLLTTHHPLFLLLLAFDFSMRLWRKNRLSPFALAGGALLRFAHVPPRMSDEAPKRFALQLGWSMIVVMTAAFVVHLAIITYVLGTILLLCAAAEALFEYCVGCRIYRYIEYFRKR